MAVTFIGDAGKGQKHIGSGKSNELENFSVEAISLREAQIGSVLEEILHYNSGPVRWGLNEW